ncbi:ATP-binding cassette domain-containing protein [Crocinitomicaceae bacterium]|jgi:ABC-2 type transport system ATP-binding protein|nr:ATP-binding cassette domain-containing protein [Crocinitomicaceae bacterium]MDB4648729.1 ATP-binding cassette domain-containing protein [Crocinitomicaceae bacterium]
MSIEVRNVFKYYGEQAAVKGISFSVKSGEIVGFLGPNGAGKSTTMKMITGFIPVTSGEILVSGMPVGTDQLNPKQKIGYLPENNPLYLDMYVREYLDFVAGIYKLSNRSERVDLMIDTLGLEVEQNKKIGALSKGYRQRVGLAQAMIHDPEVLILDEPTSGLDPNQLVEIRELIKAIGKEKTLMLSTHIMQEAEAICDRVVILSKGEIVADTPTQRLHDQSEIKTVFVEFEGKVTKSQLSRIKDINKVDQKDKGWLLYSKSVDPRSEISRFSQENNLIILTLQLEQKSLSSVFKDLTN